MGRRALLYDLAGLLHLVLAAFGSLGAAAMAMPNVPSGVVVGGALAVAATIGLAVLVEFVRPVTLQGGGRRVDAA